MAKRRKKIKLMDRTVAACGAGAGVSIAQVILTKEYIDPMLGPIPIVGDYLGVWGRWSTFGNILIGGSAFGISQFTKKSDLSNFLAVYGITTLIGGLMNGIFPAAAGLRIRAPARRIPTRAPLRRAPVARRPTPQAVTSPYYPPLKILS